jgi:hypothetical protein
VARASRVKPQCTGTGIGEMILPIIGRSAPASGLTSFHASCSSLRKRPASSIFWYVPANYPVYNYKCTNASLRELQSSCYSCRSSTALSLFSLRQSQWLHMASDSVQWALAIVLTAIVTCTLFWRFFHPTAATFFKSYTTAVVPHAVITDLTMGVFPPEIPPSAPAHSWHRVEKDLNLYMAKHSEWLYLLRANENELGAEDLVVTDIRVGEPPPNSSSNSLWESRPGGIWVLRCKYSGKIGQAITEVDVLFGVDAVDPRPQWTLTSSPLKLHAQPKGPVARLSILRGRAKPRPDVREALRVRKGGTLKILQISDTHMVTGVGTCKDAMDADGKYLPESEADPLTVNFIGKVLDVEGPDLVVFTGDQLHHDIPDSQSALFKAVAPIIERSIPFAAVFGNHDSEGAHAMSRE